MRVGERGKLSVADSGNAQAVCGPVLIVNVRGGPARNAGANSQTRVRLGSGPLSHQDRLVGSARPPNFELLQSLLSRRRNGGNQWNRSWNLIFRAKHTHP